MTIANFKEKFEALVSKQPTQWHEAADFRQENRSWLKKAQAIAIKINKALSDKSISQKQLAEKMSVSPQQINKIVKGRENLTLDTITKLEKTLGIVLMDIARHTVLSSYQTNSYSYGNVRATKEAYHQRQSFNIIKGLYMEASENAKIIKLSA